MMSTAIQGPCRTCCRKEPEPAAKYIPVDTVDQNGLPIADMIYQITDIMVTLDSYLPQQICHGCLSELRSAHNFRQKCINSNTTLTKQIPKPSVSTSLQSELQLAVVCKEEQIDQELEAEEETLCNSMEEYQVEKPAEVSRKVVENVQNKSTPTKKNRWPKREGGFLREIANAHVKMVDNRFACAMDDDVQCFYAQRRYEPNNFVRHFRTKHKEAAWKLGLLAEDDEPPEKKPRTIPKMSTEIDAKYLIESSLKLIAFHNLPLDCFQWDGIRSIYKPLMEPLGLEINGEGMIRCIRRTAERMISRIRQDMSVKMVSILIDSAVRRGQHVLTVSSQFVLKNVVETRVLGLIWVTPGQTAKLLKCKVEEILNNYGLTEKQILAVIVETGTNMHATVKKLSKSFWDAARVNFGEDTDGSEMNRMDELLEALSAELRDRFNVIRGPLRHVHLALNDVLPDTDPNLFRFNRFAQDLRNAKYEEFFVGGKGYPPVYSGSRWTSKYKLIRSIFKQRRLLDVIAQKNPEMALHDHEWQYVQEFNEAFQPLYDITKRMQQTDHHQPFSEFYMQCLMAIKELRNNRTNNRFASPLFESLTTRVTMLRENMAFRAVMFLDPRFNYCDSIVFTLEQRDEMKNYIVSIWNRIQNLRSDSGADTTTADGAKQEDTKDDMDDFLSEMFGGPSKGKAKPLPVPLTSSVTPILAQLKSLEIEPRQAHNYDVWKHWLLRAETHPELFSVAMVVLSLPSNTVDLQRAFSALVLSDRRDDLSEKNLEELLLVRLNRQLFERTVLSMSDWKQILGS